MVDNEKYDDEYEFVDPDTGSVDAMDYTPDVDAQPSGEQSIVDKAFAGKSGVIRNVLIVVVLVIAVMVIYPFIHSSMSTQKKTPAMTAVTPIKEYIAPVAAVAPVQDTGASTRLNEEVSQKLAALESAQQQMQTEFVSSHSQLSGISTNINEIMTKVSELNNTISLYASKVEEQSREIEKLTAEAAAMKKARTPHVVHHKVTTPPLKYYIQAVIPGRAWLIANNGSTLTVREGTVIAGLGMVKLIDARQGRVVIGSGRVIRFSQEDS